MAPAVIAPKTTLFHRGLPEPLTDAFELEGLLPLVVLAKRAEQVAAAGGRTASNGARFAGVRARAAAEKRREDIGRGEGERPRRTSRGGGGR